MATPEARPLTGPGVRVLLVGTGTYEHLPDVPAVAQTLKDLRDALVERCGLSPDHVAVVADPADSKVVGRSLAAAAAAASDVLLFYFVGHGLISAEGELFLATTGSDPAPDMLPFSGLPYDRVRRALLNTTARTTVVILDCCFSGRAVGALSGSGDAEEAANLAGVEGSFVLTAAARDQLALAPPGEPYTAFTGALLRLLATGDPEAGADLTLRDVYAGLTRELPARGLPRPQSRVSANAADLVLLPNPAYTPAPGPALDPLPADLRTTLDEPRPGRRAATLLGLESLLGSTNQEVRDAARRALLQLVRDHDPAVSGPAVALWHDRGLGEVPLPEAVTGTDPAGGVSSAVQQAVPAGIDFGTTNSAVAVWQDGECRVVPNRLGERTTPSVAAWSPQGTWLVGTPAKRQASTNAATFRAVKLRLGTDWTAPLGGGTVDAQQVAAVILDELKSAAEEFLEAPLGSVVLTVPAYFDLGQRQATMAAARKAGLDVQRLLNEPTAAALAYGVSKVVDQTVLVFDLGGGTFDVSLLEIGEGVAEVKATAGDNHLGGENWDERIVERLVAGFRLEHGIDLTQHDAAMERLREAAEAAKIQLSSAQETAITLPYLVIGPDRSPLTLEYSLSRAEFQSFTRDLLERTRRPLDQVLRDAGYKVGDIDVVLLVGGATRMPAVAQLVRELTGRAPRRDVIPDGVAIGAAVQSATLAGAIADTLLLDAISLSLGLETKGGVMTKLIERNTTIPTKRSEIFTTADDNQTEIEIHLYQGESEATADNTFIGRLVLTGIPELARGVPQIEVRFDIDANGILHVTAKDLGTGKEANLLVTRHREPRPGAARRPPAYPSARPASP
jgi:molecular chaperone DnaK